MPRLATLCWHTFISSALRPNAWVIDLGANLGKFSHQVERRFGSRCLAVEAAPHLFSAIPVSERIRKVHRAVCGVRGAVSFQVSRRGDASSLRPLPAQDVLETHTVAGTDLETLLAEQEIDGAGVDLVKVDIEGAEVEMLAATSDEFLRTVPQLSIEFHDFCGLVSTTEVAQSIRRLRALGFHCFKFSRRTNENILFVNSALVPLSASERMWIRARTELLLRPWWFVSTRLPRWLNAR